MPQRSWQLYALAKPQGGGSWWPDTEAAGALEVHEGPTGPLASRPHRVHHRANQGRETGGPIHGRRQRHDWPEAVVQEDFDAFQDPPPMDRPAAWIFQLPDMDLPETEPA